MFGIDLSETLGTGTQRIRSIIFLLFGCVVGALAVFINWDPATTLEQENQSLLRVNADLEKNISSLKEQLDSKIELSETYQEIQTISQKRIEELSVSLSSTASEFKNCSANLSSVTDRIEEMVGKERYTTLQQQEKSCRQTLKAISHPNQERELIFTGNLVIGYETEIFDGVKIELQSANRELGGIINYTFYSLNMGGHFYVRGDMEIFQKYRNISYEIKFVTIDDGAVRVIVYEQKL